MYSPRDYSHHYKSKNIDDGDAQEGTFKPKEYHYYYSYNHPVLCGCWHLLRAVTPDHACSLPKNIKLLVTP